MLGRHNPVMRRIRTLRRDPSLRRSERVFLAEGIHLAKEALASGVPIETFVVSPRLETTQEGRELLEAIRRRDLPIAETSDATLRTVQDARSPQPVVCLVRRQDLSAGELERAVDEATLIVVLEGIQDPGNLGSILRSADGAGANLCFVCGRSVDPYHPRAVRSTMGSLFRVPVVEERLDSVVDRLRRSTVKLVGADARGGAEYDRAELAGPLAFIFGSEGAGLAPEVRDRLDLVLRIPLREGVESLSVGAAAAVMLFEAARQRRS